MINQIPKTHEAGSAGIAFAISLTSILVVLFTGEGVTNFSDISQVQYAVAFLTSAGIALKDIQAQRKEVQ